mgnify:CR=1 FL=1
MNEYSKTVNLPQTSFQMRANLSQSEPKWIDFWKNMKIHEKLKEKNIQSKSFILHDGPPYANGHLHLGHALNKILKDIICRINFKLGYNVNFVPGWDCHGLPIEWEVEENYRKKKKSKEDIDVISFREECRNFAKKWIDIQCEEFIRLGLDYDWKNKYTTMHRDAEATIVSELLKFLEKGILYLGKKPVMWSVVEKTALAEAEIEYLEKNSKSIFVKFPIKKNDNLKFQNCSVAIWTTTPWTLPGNMAIAYSNSIEYQIITFSQDYPNFKLNKGESLIFSKKLFKSFSNDNKIKNYKIEDKITGSELSNILCSHPLAGLGYEHTIPLIEGFHVTDDTGTGFVHIAPGHGDDDYVLGIENNVDIIQTVEDDGKYNHHAVGFEGEHVYKVDQKIADKLKEFSKLLFQGTLRHSYPHSWRSKAPLIYRNTPQWFISMEKKNLRKIALKSIDETIFYPSQGQKRLRSMIETRPDWCVSRQRVWGVPLPLFIDKKTGKPLKDENVINRIADIYEKEGSNTWFSENPQRFLGDEYNADDYEQVKDVVEVWFDSGSTHAFCLEKREDLKWPASMYLEGSDQHRGWFHSSLLESSGTRGRAPYESVLTHGFVVDGKGRKMSKSLGNVISPDDILKKYGVDILRLWVVASDYYDDLKLDNAILQSQAESYRRIRNTFRFLIGNLHNYSSEEIVAEEDFPELEKYLLHRLWEVDQVVKKCVKTFNFHLMFTTLLNFCSNDLSAFYFDIRKDIIYCDSSKSNTRKSSRTLLDIIFNHLVRWFSPSISFTTEEAWKAIGKNNSVHLEDFLDCKDVYQNKKLSEKWSLIKNIRKVSTGAIEKIREEKIIRSSLEAHLDIYVSEDIFSKVSEVLFDEVTITSSFKLHIIDSNVKAFEIEDLPNIKVSATKVNGYKCQRCWKYEDQLINNEICQRCNDAIS